MPYLYISTAFSVVQEVLPALEYIAAKNKLALYDVERDKTYYKNLVDDAFITQKLREKTLKETILKNTRALWRYNKIFSANEENQSAFVITVYRIKGVIFAERTKWFYECLLSALTEDETLECEDRTFKVCGTDYTISFLFEGYKEHANMIMVYILGVLLTSIATSHQIYSLISSIASVFIFNYLFTAPRFSLAAYDTGYPVTFVVMFLTAYITGTLAVRYKEQARQSEKIAKRTKILFDTDQLLSKAENKLAILQTAGQQINKLLGRSIVIFDHEGGQLSEPILFISDEQRFYDEETELAIVEWVLQNNHNAGATTKNFPDAQYLYFAVRVNERIYGVVGIDAMTGALDASEQGILLSILGETALALENEKNIREKEAAAILAESEQLRANLLRAISHDLRTPLTTISGNAGNLLHNSHSFDDETKQQIYADIYDDSMWLTNLVENLLYSTRIEEGRMMLKTSPELVSEIIEEAMQHIRPNAKKHSITVNYGDDLLMVRADAKLIVQVIINLVDNALKYTPSDTLISISAECKNGMAEIKIADTGKGISDVEKGKIFDKFYSGEHKIADNRRSLGLGLYLCKAIVEAHGGSIHVTDNLPHGSVFRFTLPLEEVIIHE